MRLSLIHFNYGNFNLRIFFEKIFQITVDPNSEIRNARNKRHSSQNRRSPSSSLKKNHIRTYGASGSRPFSILSRQGSLNPRKTPRIRLKKYRNDIVYHYPIYSKRYSYQPLSYQQSPVHMPYVGTSSNGIV